MATVILDAGDSFTLASNATVRGSSGSETVKVLDGVVATLDSNVERIELPRASSAYTYQATANGVAILYNGTVVATAFNADKVAFTDGSATVAGTLVGTTLSFTLGGAAVSTTAGAVTPTLSTATGEASTISTGSTGGGSTTGQSFSLTTAADLMGPNVVTSTSKTTSGNDTIYGLTASSLTTNDIVDGGDGTDSLIADYDVGAGSLTIAPLLTSVESLTLRNTGTSNTTGDTLTFSAANATGLTSVNFDQITGTTGAAALVASGLDAGVTTIGVSKNAGQANTYTFTYADAAVAGTANTLTMNVTGNTTATGAVVIRGTTSTAAGAGVETVTINTTGTGTAAASTLASVLSADGGGSTSVLKTLNITGSSNLTINSSVDFAGTSGGTIVATGMSGDLTLTATSGNEPITFTGGSGKNNVTVAGGNDSLTGGSNDDTFTIGTGNDTVVGNAGNDRVVLSAITDLNSLDSIALGDGTRDTLAIGTWTAVNGTNFSASNKALIAATVTGQEVVELTAADVTAIDYSAIAQDIVRLSGGDGGNGAANTVITNAATNDVLINNYTTNNVTGATGSSAVTISAVLPNQTFKIELFGSGVGYTNVATAGTDHAIETVSNVTTLAIDSSTSATDTSTTVNTIGGTLEATAFAIKNTSAQTLVITGNKDLTIVNTAGTATAAFSNGIDVNASAFTGKLVLSGSNSNDSIKGGTGNDVITGAQGSDTIDLSAGGNDKVVFTALNSTDKDTIKSFTSGDTINVAALGDGTTGSLDSVITSAAAQSAMTADRAYIINTNGTAANLTTSGTAVITDMTSAAQVSVYLNERFTTTATTQRDVIIINDTTSGQNKTYVWNYVDAGTAGFATNGSELTLVGVIENGGTALGASAVVFA